MKWGLAASLCAALAIAVSSIVLRKIGNAVHYTVTCFWCFFICLVICVPFAYSTTGINLPRQVRYYQVIVNHYYSIQFNSYKLDFANQYISKGRINAALSRRPQLFGCTGVIRCCFTVRKGGARVNCQYIANFVCISYPNLLA